MVSLLLVVKEVVVVCVRVVFGSCCSCTMFVWSMALMLRFCTIAGAGGGGDLIRVRLAPREGDFTLRLEPRDGLQTKVEPPPDG